MACDFDPWHASAEEAIEAQRQHGNYCDPGGPLYQFVAAKQIEAMKAKVDAGDGFAVLTCIRICVTRGLVAPVWLAYAFNRRYDAVLNCRAGSWDSPLAFGKPYRKGAHIAALRKARTNRFAVWNAINDIRQREPETAIDKGLFERVGRPLGLGATLAEELYYQAKRLIRF
ncbi:MAG: hypothetical protein KDE68_01815 [Rhodocyclaceae bacterium]|nr:hypothetical protein [Rhodocyclaceae bacterium]